MRQFICLFTIIANLFAFSNVLAGPVKPEYPSVLNLDNHKSISLHMISNQDKERAIITEFLYNNNKRADLNTTEQKHSFRSFNGNNYSININKGNEKSCHHIDDIDSYMFLSNLRLAWKRYEEGQLTFLGQQDVDNVPCNVWKFNEENEEYTLSTSIPQNPTEQAELKRIVKTKHHAGKQTIFTYNKIEFGFDYKIDDDKFVIPDDIYCD